MLKRLRPFAVVILQHQQHHSFKLQAMSTNSSAAKLAAGDKLCGENAQKNETNFSVANAADATTTLQAATATNKSSIKLNNRYARKRRRRLLHELEKEAESTILAVATAGDVGDDGDAAENSSALTKKRLRLATLLSEDEKILLAQQTISRPPHGSSYFRNKSEKFEDQLDRDAHFYTENNLLKVRSYDYTWSAFAKTRWVGRPILEVFRDEFQSSSESIQAERLRQFRVRVNDQVVQPDYMVKDGDFIQHAMHRHECPALACAAHIPIVYEDEHVLVVNKPSSLPVHPCGRYNFLSLLGILSKFHNKRNLKITHRLDKGTSGIVIFGKTTERAQRLAALHTQQAMHKEYICRVRGQNFPDGLVECREPIACIDGKLALYLCRPDGKPSTTTFEKLHALPETNESIVIARPVTGRTHQIRVHLLFLGFPIANDPIYARPVYTAGKLKQEELELLFRASAAEHNAPPFIKRTEKPTNEEELAGFRDDCPECGVHYIDPKPQDMVLYLHAFRYKGEVTEEEKFEYVTELPEWATVVSSSSPLTPKPPKTDAVLTVDVADKN